MNAFFADETVQISRIPTEQSAKGAQSQALKSGDESTHGTHPREACKLLLIRCAELCVDRSERRLFVCEFLVKVWASEKACVSFPQARTGVALYSLETSVGLPIVGKYGGGIRLW